MTDWLLNRLFESKDQPQPRFAFQGTVNWMRALAILTNPSSFDAALKVEFSSVQRRKTNESADTVAFENMLMAFHNQACLDRLTRDSDGAYDLVRAAIVSWYYGTYFASSAMIAAASGSSQETHSATARVWQKDIVSQGHAVYPFSLCLTSLVKKDSDAVIANYRGNDHGDLNSLPQTVSEARAAIVSYLSGTRDYEKWKVEERIKNSTEFKSLGVNDFRKKPAQTLRDSQLSKGVVNYLVQSFRYRGKANYRDSIFLSYGQDNSDRIATFVNDLTLVSRAFQRMSALYVARRVEKGAWQEFLKDLRRNSRLSLAVDYLEV